MSEKLDELKKEAADLGIEFAKNIGEAKLQAKIDEYYESQETSGAEVEQAVEQSEEKTNEKPAVSGKKSKMQRVREAEAKAKKTKVVTIIDNDQRVNNQTTSCTVNCTNEYFDLGTIVLPLNMPVEVMVGHLGVLSEVKIPQHVKDPKTGLHTVVLRKRYTISYEDMKGEGA
jgi:L-lactate utilization protein LutC